ncbi:hypothetical protein [Alicyclobacillus sp. SP_1]|jgi:hypothetical protein|uniref:hypothetical protein n=1 Tax=Alicyclobacillus sp. SP_1 TaxID=2942475 RepID=UPI002157A7C7|nr:hypothetical protein [Alicyclobacillus sp. SP_1]MCY0908589.1 hypothetical protein [Sulfobacillus thermotolerans]
MVRRARLRRWKISWTVRGDLEDTLVFVAVAFPLSLIVLWFAISTVKVLQAHEILYNTAQSAVVSGVTQAEYDTQSGVDGTTFASGIQASVAQAVTARTWQTEMASTGIEHLMQVSQVAVTFPSPQTEQLTVHVQYQPHGVYAALSVLSGLLHSGTVQPQPFVWTVAPTASFDAPSESGL